MQNEQEKEKKTGLKAGWKKGQSGNPKGRPSGSRNRATAIASAVLEKDIAAIVGKVVEAALGGDMVAARMCVERLIPPARERALKIDLPSLDTVTDCARAQSAIVGYVASGELLPAEGCALSGLVENQRKAFETIELEARISALEQGVK
ncbi:MAG: DUF5681 domain-containing protein [Sulfuricellaceae bacterium]|nr:DUF5681 domain-containing protein [Sulfuricellaceae bacterium]